MSSKFGGNVLETIKIDMNVSPWSRNGGAGPSNSLIGIMCNERILSEKGKTYRENGDMSVPST